LFGTKRRPRTHRGDLSPRVAAVIETPKYGLTIFKVHLGALTLKGYTKGEHVLRFEAVAHNAKALGVGRVLDCFPDIVARLAGMLERFCTTVDCVDVSYLPDGILDELAQPSMIGRTRVGGIDLDKPRTRSVLTALAALAAAPDGSPSPTSPPRSAPAAATTTPPAKPPTTSANSAATTSSPNPTTTPLPRRTPSSPDDHRPPRPTRPRHRPHPRRRPQPPTRPQIAHWTAIDRDYETLRTAMQTLIHHLALTTQAA
jgi:hypothetical protein